MGENHFLAKRMILDYEAGTASNLTKAALQEVAAANGQFLENVSHTRWFFDALVKSLNEMNLTPEFLELFKGDSDG